MERVFLFERRVSFPSESIPGTDHLADVASKNPIPDLFSQFNWNAIFKFNGVVEDTAGRVDGAVGENTVRRAGFDAACAGTTMIRDERRIGFENQIKKDFGQQKIRAMVWMEKKGILADPADACTLSEITFKDGTGIRIPAIPDWTSNLLLDKLNKFLHPCREDVMIVVAPGIGGDLTPSPSPHGGWRRVRSGQYQNRFTFWQDCMRVRAAGPGTISGKIIHCAMMSLSEPVFECREMGGGGGGGHA